jgi:hypothetical protein
VPKALANLVNGAGDAKAAANEANEATATIADELGS